MKFICVQKNLSSVLNLVSHLAGENKNNLPILNNLLLEAKKGFLEISATNLEIAFKAKVRAKIEKQGKITIPAQILTNYINSLKDENLTFELKESNMYIWGENSQAKIITTPTEDFPIIPQIESGKKYKIKSDILKQNLEKIIFSISPLENRIEISGGLFIFNSPEEGKLTLVGTDSYRLAENIVPLISSEKSIFKVIVPYKTLSEVLKITDEEDIDIIVSENQISFVNSYLEIISRIISAEFPDYKEIIPNKFKTKIILKRNDILNALKSVSCFSEKNINDIHFEVKKDKLKFFSSSNIGESYSELNADIEGIPNKIVFNSKYLMDFLTANKEEEIIMEIIDENCPAVFRLKDKLNYLYLLMPIKG
jgi:DNA polymerase-3 subunit beta